MHFKYERLKNGLWGKLSIITGAVPTIFDLNKRASKENIRKERLEKRTLRVQQFEAFQTDEHPAKKKPKICDEDITDVPASEALTKSVGCKNLPYCNHDYRVLVDKVDESNRNVMCQTDLAMGDFEAMAEELQTLKAMLNSKFKQEKKVDNSKKRREMVMEDILNNDDSVKFYTGIPSLACFTLLLNTLLPLTTRKIRIERSLSVNVLSRSVKNLYLC